MEVHRVWNVLNETRPNRRSRFGELLDVLSSSSLSTGGRRGVFREEGRSFGEVIMGEGRGGFVVEGKGRSGSPSWVKLLVGGFVVVVFCLFVRVMTSELDHGGFGSDGGGVEIGGTSSFEGDC